MSTFKNEYLKAKKGTDRTIKEQIKSVSTIDEATSFTLQTFINSFDIMADFIKLICDKEKVDNITGKISDLQAELVNLKDCKTSGKA